LKIASTSSACAKKPPANDSVRSSARRAFVCGELTRRRGFSLGVLRL
jgi:hypothetical protein